jgi:hypothetical protein
MEFDSLFEFAFSDDNPGYKKDVVESPNGDSYWDHKKKYAHIAPKYFNNKTPDFVKTIYENIKRESEYVCDFLNIDKKYYPGNDSTLRLLKYENGAVTAPHTDFDLFTLSIYRNINDTFKYISGEDDSLLKIAREKYKGIHFGELMAEILGVEATKHEVISSEQKQLSIVFFAMPYENAMLPKGISVGDWVNERKKRSRKIL